MYLLTRSLFITIISFIMKNRSKFLLLPIFLIILLILSGCSTELIETTPIPFHYATTDHIFTKYILKYTDIDFRYFTHPLFSFELHKYFDLEKPNVKQVEDLESSSYLSCIEFVDSRPDIVLGESLKITIRKPWSIDYNVNDRYLEIIEKAQKTTGNITTNDVETSDLSAKYIKYSYVDQEKITFGNYIYESHNVIIRTVLFSNDGLIWEITLAHHYLDDTESNMYEGNFKHIIKTFELY